MKAGDRLEKDSDLLIDQIRTIDNKRFLEGPLLKYGEALINNAQECLREVIDAF